MPVPLPIAFPLVPAPAGVLSSFDVAGRTGGPREQLRPFAERRYNLVAPWVAGSLIALSSACAVAGHDFRVTEGFRPISAQQRVRTKWLVWVAETKAAEQEGREPDERLYAPKAAPPGRSCHGAGCAIDVHTGPLAKSLSLAQWHMFARPRGWRPIVLSTASWSTSEAWHLDCWGPLEGIRRRLGYSQAALAAHLLTGQWGHLEAQGEAWIAAACLQASLVRANFPAGSIDGVLGPATKRACTLAGIPWSSSPADLLPAAYALPTHLGEDLVRAA